MPVSSTVKISIVGIVGAVLCAAGAVLLVVFPMILKSKIEKSLPIVKGSALYSAWETAPIPIYMQYYFFNVTNAEDIIYNSSAVPDLQQVGPYTFREYRKKINISFDEENDTVSYEQLKWFVFEPDLTPGFLTDTVTTLNVPLVSLGIKSEGKLSRFQAGMINNFIRLYKASVFITKTIDELLFSGYRDEFMVFLAQKTNREILPNGTFGFMYGQNYTTDGVYTSHTGVKDFSNFPGIKEWNGEMSLSYWNDTYCNMINGTDGSAFTPFLTRDKHLQMFSTDLCRSIFISYDRDGDVYGIKTFRYGTPFELLADSSINPDNECYCEDKMNCFASGLLNVSICKKGAPLVLSPVHFYQADPLLLTAVSGLKPDKEEHDTTLDVEPITGVVVRAAKRLQINVALKPVSHIKVMDKLPEVIFPVFWVNESADIGAERAEQFKAKIYKPILIGNAVTYALLGIGVFILVVVIIFSIRLCTKKQRYSMDVKTQTTSH